MGEEYIKPGLAGLGGMLHKLFNKSIVVFIDEYDRVINNALFELKSNSKYRVVLALTPHILTTLFKQNENVNFCGCYRCFLHFQYCIIGLNNVCRYSGKIYKSKIKHYINILNENYFKEQLSNVKYDTKH